jgi:hypothetical protein
MKVISPPYSGSKNKPWKLSLPPTSACFLLSSPFDCKDGNDMFLRNVVLSVVMGIAVRIKYPMRFYKLRSVLYLLPHYMGIQARLGEHRR